MDGPFLIISGTNRPGSNALVISRILADFYRAASLPFALLDLVDIPIELFAPEAYDRKPAAFEPTREAIVAARGLHLVVPEYNGSFPGALKHVIDHLKFPDSFERKPVAFVGESDGRFGALRGVEQLQLIFGYRNALIYPERVFISAVSDEFDANEGTLGPLLRSRLEKQVLGFARHVARLRGETPGA